MGLTSPSALEALALLENGEEPVRLQLELEAQFWAQFGKVSRRKQAIRQRHIHKRNQILIVFIEKWEVRTKKETELDEFLVSQSDEAILPTEEQFEKQLLRQKQRERKEKREKRREEKRQRELAKQENEQ